MRVPDSPAGLSTRRLALVAVFLVVFGATTVAFAQAVTGHVAAMHAPSSDVTVVDYEVTDDDHLRLTLRIHNPTMKDLQLTVAQLNAYVGGEQATDGTTTRFDAVVPSGETTSVTLRLGLETGGPDLLRDADSSQVAFEGRLKAYVVDERVYVPVDERGADA